MFCSIARYKLYNSPAQDAGKAYDLCGALLNGRAQCDRKFHKSEIPYSKNWQKKSGSYFVRRTKRGDARQSSWAFCKAVTISS